MPRRDIYHNTVIVALTADGWTITDDPFTLSYGDRNVYADIGAERLISAKKGIQKIIVEVKSFIGVSEIHELEIAIGQFNLYRDILSETEPERLLYLAIPERTYKGIFSHPLGQLIQKRQQLSLVIFDEKQERIIKWIP
jgi:hypothetical protein